MNTLPYSTPDYDDVTGDSGKVDNNFWYRDVSELLGARTPPRQEYISIYGRLLVGELLQYLNVKIIKSCKMLYIVCPKVNSFALRADNNGEEENVGTALYRANSIFDHSCAPNATTIFSGEYFMINMIIHLSALNDLLLSSLYIYLYL